MVMSVLRCALPIFFAASSWSAEAGHIKPDDTIPNYLAHYGIQVQEHSIFTDDGYILTAFRLPRPGAPVALLQHGILCSSWFWIDNDPSLAPGLQVYNMGYDVWLTNSRGNMFSKRHRTLSTNSKEFWDFSFGEMGLHDVPANVGYILNQTSQPTLTYVGHSQGTSQFFAAMTSPSTKEFLEARVNLFVAMSPVTYMSHQSSLLLKAMTTFRLGSVMEKTFPYSFLGWQSLDVVSDFFCTATLGMICRIGVDVICGRSAEDTDDAITNISAHFPAGTSVKCMNHYEQLILSGKFEAYDYGEKENMKRYNTSTPPQFDLSTAKVPTALFIGGNDMLGDPTDEEAAASKFQSSTIVFKDVYDGFSHATFFAGDAPSFNKWWPSFSSLLKQYNPVPVPELSSVLV